MRQLHDHFPLQHPEVYIFLIHYFNFLSVRKDRFSRVQYCTPSIPAFRKQAGRSEFDVSLVYIVSSRQVKATQ